ncbi:MAG TPA: GntR family transcriptional regulator [Spirochaetia bacterium]|nr:GntR family transcriptional regulator [Spirochaetia bacterium]
MNRQVLMSYPATPDGTIRRDYRTINELVFHSLLEDVLSGRLKPGERLNIDEIARRMGVSRTPVREALKQLVAAGLVENEPHRSPFIKALSFEEVIELFCIRAALDGMASRLAAHHISDEQLNYLDDCCRQMESLVELRQYNETLAINFKFHSVIYQAANAPRLSESCLMFYRHTEQARHLVIDLPGSHAEICQEHRVIAQALRSRDSEAADNATRQHYFNSARRVAKSVGKEIAI